MTVRAELHPRCGYVYTAVTPDLWLLYYSTCVTRCVTVREDSIRQRTKCDPNENMQNSVNVPQTFCSVTCMFELNVMMIGVLGRVD